MSTEIKLIEPGHVYLVNGKPRPSVTQVLESVGISNYSAIPAETRENALARGSRVHTAIHFDLEFQIGVSRDPLDEDSVSSIDRPFFEAYRKFARDHKFRPALIEHRHYNEKYQFCGSLDTSGCFEAHPAQPLLVDWKTGAAEFWVRLQLAAYASFFAAPRTYTRICVELHDDSTYKVYVFEGRDWQQDFNEFLYALQVYRIKSERRLK